MRCKKCNLGFVSTRQVHDHTDSNRRRFPSPHDVVEDVVVEVVVEVVEDVVENLLEGVVSVLQTLAECRGNRFELIQWASGAGSSNSWSYLWSL